MDAMVRSVASSSAAAAAMDAMALPPIRHAYSLTPSIARFICGRETGLSYQVLTLTPLVDMHSAQQRTVS